MIRSIILAVVLAPLFAYGQDPAPAPAVSISKWNGWAVSGTADGYFTFNTNHPASGSNQLQNFDLNYSQPELSLAKITVNKSDKVIGLHADIGFGETLRYIHGADPAAIDHKGLRYVEQVYLIAKPTHTHGTEIDFGQFVTSAGTEVIESNANWNYTRSLLFVLATPYYHFGFRSSVPVTKQLTVGFQLVNAWNTVWGNNNLDNIGVTLAFTNPKYVWSVNYYEGPNHQGTTKGKRNLIDSSLVVNPSGKLSVYVNGDYGRDNRVTGGYDYWYGVATAARFQVFKRISLAGRAEIFDDGTGFTTGTKQTLKEGTLTAEYKCKPYLVARADFRRDLSDRAYFDRGAEALRSKNMNTITIGFVIVAGPFK